MMLIFVFFSFHIFASLEPISDSAHTLGVIDDAMDQVDALKEEHFIDGDGRDIALDRFDIEFSHVDFGYGRLQYWYGDKEAKDRAWDIKYVKANFPCAEFIELKDMGHASMASLHPPKNGGAA